MLVYWLVFSLPIVAFILPFKVNNETKNLFHISYLFILTIFVGLRTNTGGDWRTNNYVFDGTAIYATKNANISVSDILKSEIGYDFLIQIIKTFSLGFQSLIFVVSILFIYCIYVLGKLSKGYLSTYIVSFPVIITVAFFGYIRQGIAFCFLILAIYSFTANKKRSFIYFYILISIGTLFHKSLIVFFILPLFFVNLNKRVLFLILIGLIFFLILFYLNYDAYLRLYRFYLGEDIYFSSSGALFRWILNFIPSFIYIFLLYKFIENGKERKIFYIFSLVSIFSIFLIFSFSSFVDRYLIYFSMLQAYVYGNLFYSLKDPIINYVSRVILIIFYVFVYFIWFNFSVHADLWIPYDNILFFSQNSK